MFGISFGRHAAIETGLTCAEFGRLSLSNWRRESTCNYQDGPDRGLGSIDANTAGFLCSKGG